MKKLLSSWCLFSILLFFATPLAAQAPSRPEIVGVGSIADLEEKLKELSELYFSGNWCPLQEAIDKIVGQIKITWIGSGITNKLEINERKNFYFIVFLSREESEEPQLIRVAWHKPRPDPYAARIPGQKQIFEIVLGEKTEFELKTSYISTELENPLLAQIPKFAKLIEPVILTSLGKEVKEPAAPPANNVEIRSIGLPYKRAKIKVNDIMVLSDAALGKAIKTAARKLIDDLQYRDTYPSEPGKNLAAEINKKIQEVKVIDNKTGLLERMQEAVDLAYRNHINKSKPKQEEINLAMKIEEKFLAMIEEAGAQGIKAEFDYENVPLEWLSFGLISTRMIENSFTGERVKVTDSGMYTADPPKSPLTAAIVNIHPFKYDPKSAKMKPAEMFRLFGGFVLTPDYGYCAGAGFSFMRGLSINAGLAMIGFDIVNNPQSIMVDGTEMQKPENPEKPFKTKWGTVFFFGFGYSFQ